MENPWIKIPKRAPYVLPEDYPLIANFNKTANSRQQIRLNIAPQPFLGNPKTAEVYLLNLNPGYSEKHEQAIFFTKLYNSENFKSFSFKNKLPFYLLNPKLSNTLGSIWWRRMLSDVIKVWGLGRTAQKVMCVEFFPYHSINFKPMKTSVPSQEYSFYLVRQAVKNSKTIIIMRSLQLWLKAIPELKDYPYILLKNRQRPWISENNIPNNKFTLIFNSSGID